MILRSRVEWDCLSPCSVATRLLVTSTVSLLLGVGGVASAKVYDLEKLEAQKPTEMTTAPEPGMAFLEDGREVYFKRCMPCHGRRGEGDGLAAPYLDPRPRDFSLGMFKFRTTLSGEMPTDADLFRTVSFGVPGTAMPAWGEGDMILPERERWAAIYFIKSMVEDFQSEDLDPYADGKQIQVGVAPKATPERLAAGRKAFMDKDQAACVKCHGDSGRGNGSEAGTHKDDWQDPILPRDLTKPWRYKNGSNVEDIFRTLTLGLNGTPMPSFLDALESDDDRWDLALFVKSLQEFRRPEALVLDAEKVAGNLPAEPADDAWLLAQTIEVTTGGQVVIGPRWQNPSVDVVSIQALYNQEEIAFRLSWNDRTENLAPDDFDPANPAATAIKYSLDDDDAEEVESDWGRLFDEDTVEQIGDPWAPKDTFLSTLAAEYRATFGRLPDGLALHFPQKLPEPGIAQKPYLFMGDARNPLNAWQWVAGADAVIDSGTRGPTKGYTPQKDGSVSPTANAMFEDGQWHLVIRRPLIGDKKGDTQFQPGRLIPFSLRVWDGGRGEAGRQSATSAWYFLNLKSTTPLKAYGYGGFAALLMLGFQLLIVRRARKGQEGSS